MLFIKAIALLVASAWLAEAVRPVAPAPEVVSEQDASAPARGSARAAGQQQWSFVQKPNESESGDEEVTKAKGNDLAAKEQSGKTKTAKNSSEEASLEKDVKTLEEDAELAFKRLNNDEIEYEHWEAGNIKLVLIRYLIIPVAVLPFYICFCRSRPYSRYDTFATGLFDCWGDSRICACAFCCPCLRWADTVSKEKAGLVNFFVAFVMFLMLFVAVRLSVVGWFVGSIALTSLGTIYRQKLRATYGLTSWTLGTVVSDCWVWFCCLWCAVAQEARHVEWFEGEVERLTEARGAGMGPPSGKSVQAPVSEVMTEPKSKDVGEAEKKGAEEVS